MRKVESDCVGCGLPCTSTCPYYGNSMHLYCDKCGDEVNVLYKKHSDELCIKCLVYGNMKDFIDSLWDEDDFQTIVDEWASNYAMEDE